MNKIDKLKGKIKVEREKNEQLKQEFRKRKREILQQLDDLKEKVKDILYTGDL